MSDPATRRQRPHGVAELTGRPAAAREHYEWTVQRVFARWGYQRIYLPTFGYYDVLATGASPEMQQGMYRFFDREGHELALRTDLTVPTARVVGTRLYDQPVPQRYYYTGNVFRHTEPQAGQLREFTQAGIELIGADTPEADAEVVSVAVACLKALDIARFQINLGQVGYLRAIVAQAGASGEPLAALEQAISRKNDLEIASTLNALGIHGPVGDAIRAIPHLCGDESVLAEADKLATNAEAGAVIARLRRVYALLATEGVSDHIIIDLGEVRSMDYYTGITFHGYVAGLGFHVISGGRYDGLIAHFGPPLPAVGFALGLERAALVARGDVDIVPDLLMATCDHAACRMLADDLRANGLRVEVDVLGRRGADLLAHASAVGARRVLQCEDGQRYTLIQDGTAVEQGYAALREEASTWSR